MATTTKEQTDFKPKRLFKVTKELNVVTDKIVAFLKENGYEDDFTGTNVTDRITSEEAYLALKEEFASDAESAARLAELRAEQDEAGGPDRDEVATIGADDEEEAEEEPEDVAEAPVETAKAGEEAVPEQEISGDGAPAPDEVEAEEAEPADEVQTAAETAGLDRPEEEAADEYADEAEARSEDAPATTDVPPEETAEEEDAAAGEAPEASAETTEQDVADAEPAAEALPEAEVEAPATGGEAATGEAAAAGDASAEAEQVEDEDGNVLRGDRYSLQGASVVGKVDLSKFKRRKRKRKKKKKEKRKSKQRSRDKGKKKKGGKKKKKKKGPAPEQDAEERLQETLRDLEQNATRERQRRRQRRRERHAAEREAERERRRARENVLRVTEYVSTGELANLMEEPVNDVISTLFEAGLMVSINQRLDAETIELVAKEYGFEVEFTTEYGVEDIEVEEDEEENLVPRAPVVTVMGHVDHGKTSLLDYVRKENVVGGEAGGITQHIGAYKVGLDSGDEITFLDTPGHEAFTAMRARGAKATDVVILVVAADDGVMPRTREAISHAQAAEVPMVVAINKMDLPEADEQRTMQQLAEENVLVEQYGGEVQCALVSAETGEGIEDLLEKIVLESELHDLQANPARVGSGVVIESHLEKGRGNVVTALIKNGTLRVGDPFIAGMHSGRVRAMFNEHDQRIEEAGPSEPALVLGSNGGPEVGDQFVVFEDEGEAREIAQRRQQIRREQRLRQKSHVTLDEIGRRLALGEFHELNLVIKADVSGSVEALSDALLELRTEEVAVNVVHSGAGAVTESDVMLAAASDAVIVAFQVRPTPGARGLAKQEEIDIRTYSVIYDAIEEVRDALEGMLEPERREETLGHAEVREIFKVPDVGTVAGCRVTDGRIHRNDKIRVVREGVVTYEGRLGSLKHHQEDRTEIQDGYECGLSIENFDDIKVGDELETYRVEKIARTLEGV